MLLIVFRFYSSYLRLAADLGVLEEAQLVVNVHSQVLGAGPDGGDEDHVALLALELLHRPDLDVRAQLPHLQGLTNLLNL